MMIQETLAYVKKFNYIAQDVLELELIPQDYISYAAGQYLMLDVAKENAATDSNLPRQALYFSIANAPNSAHSYFLHIRMNQQSLLLQNLTAIVDANQPLRIQLPFGNCSVLHLDAKKSILFLAEGTGFAQSHAMLLYLLAEKNVREYQLIWAARSQDSLYYDDKIKQWEKNYKNFCYVPVITENPKEHLIAHALSLHPSDIKNWQMVLSGSFEMVYRIRDSLVSLGISPKNIYSDAFAFEDKNK